MEKDFQYYKKWAISYLDAELKELTATKEINKGSIALPVGTISTWNGVEYIKTAAGKWIRYLSGKLNEKKEKIKQAIKEIDKTTDFTELETTCKKYSQLFRRKNGTYPEEYKEIEKAAYRKTLYLMDQYKKEHLAKGGFGMKDDKFESIKAKVIAHLEELENQENNEKKAIKKSLLEAESMEKSGKGLPVGTVREWKGKKYVKIAPGKWKPKYDSESRGAKMAVAAIKKKAQACKDGKELMQLMLENRDRFSDANGRPLPFVKELSEYISSMNDSIESKKEPEKKTEKTEPKAKKEESKEPEDKKEDTNNPEEKQNYKVVDADGKEISNTDAKNNYKKNVEQIKFFEDSMKDLDKHEEGKFEFTINYLKKYNDDILSKLNDSDKKEIESYKPGNGISEKIELGNLSNEGIGASDTVDIGVRIASDTDRMLKRELQDAHSDVFRYGDKFKDRIGQIEYAIGVKDKIKNFDNLDTKEQSDLINDLEHIVNTAKGLERGYGKDESKRIIKENMAKVVKEMKSKMKDKEKNKKYDDSKAYEEYKKLALKKDTTREDDIRISELLSEHSKNSKVKWDNPKKLRSDKIKGESNPENRYEIDSYKEAYEDYDEERLMNMYSDGKKFLKKEEDKSKVDKLKNQMDAIREVLYTNYSNYVPKYKESESEKRQNRSDAMKGNKNAYKGGPKEDEKSNGFTELSKEEISKMSREESHKYYDRTQEYIPLDKIGFGSGKIRNIDTAMDIVQEIADKYGTSEEGIKKLQDFITYNVPVVERIHDDLTEKLGITIEGIDADYDLSFKNALKKLLVKKTAADKKASSKDSYEKKYSPEAEKTIKNFEKRIADIDDKLKMFDNNPSEASQRMSKQYEKQKKELQKELSDFKKNAGGNKESGSDKGSEVKNEGKRDIKETKRLYNEAREKLHNLDKERDKLKRNGGDYTKNDKEISNLESKISEYGREIQNEENINNLRSSLEHYISHRNYTKDLEDKNKKPEVTWNRFVSKYLVGYSTISKDLYSDNGFDRAIKDIKNAKNIPDDVKKMLTESVEKYKQYYSGDSKKESGSKFTSKQQKEMKKLGFTESGDTWTSEVDGHKFEIKTKFIPGGQYNDASTNLELFIDGKKRTANIGGGGEMVDDNAIAKIKKELKTYGYKKESGPNNASVSKESITDLSKRFQKMKDDIFDGVTEEEEKNIRSEMKSVTEKLKEMYISKKKITPKDAANMSDSELESEIESYLAMPALVRDLDKDKKEWNAIKSEIDKRRNESIAKRDESITVEIESINELPISDKIAISKIIKKVEDGKSITDNKGTKKTYTVSKKDGVTKIKISDFSDYQNPEVSVYRLKEDNKGMKKSTIMIRKDVHDDCMDILRG